MERTSVFSSGDSGKSEIPNGGTVGASDGISNAARGNGSGTSGERPSIIDPGKIGSEGSNIGSDGSIAGEPVRKRRYTKRGSPGSKGAEAVSVDSLAGIIFNAHAMLAAMTKTQEWLLDPKEATDLAQATANVSRHYSVAPCGKNY